MTRPRSMVILALMGLVLLSAASAQAAPAIIDVLVDGTGSMRTPDFKKANEAVIEFIDAIYARSQRRGGELADFISVNYWGSDKDYDGTRFINGSDLERLLKLAVWVNSKQHPKYGNTHTYSAIAKALLEVRDFEQKLPVSGDTYYKFIVVITDGQDNDRNTQIKKQVRANFPNQYIHLFVIGVGSAADVSEFRGVADLVQNINSFDRLTAAMLAVLDRM